MPRALAEFVNDARALGPYNAPQNVAENAVLRTAIDLCEQAGVWTFEYTFPQQDGVPDYPLFVPEFTRIVCMNWVKMGGQTYYPAPGNDRCQCGAFNISMPNAKTIVLRPTPWPACELVQVTVQLWLTPTLEACELPEILWQEYSDTIANGAAARMLMMPKQDWTNQGLSQKMYGLYIVGKTQAKNKRVQQRTTGPLLMRGSYFVWTMLCTAALAANSIAPFLNGSSV